MGEWESLGVGEFFFYISAFGLDKCIRPWEQKCLQKPCAFFLLPSSFFLQKPSLKIVDNQASRIQA
ncbi:MAG: hypothetical protein WCF82_02165, partial [Microcoleus sp.]